MATNSQDEMTFLEHLEILRWHIVRSLVAVVLMAIVAFIFKRIVFDVILLAPRQPEFFTNRILCEFGLQFNVKRLCINQIPIKLQNIFMAGQFTTHIMISLIAGIVVGSPYIFYELWRFLQPALYKNEKTYAGWSILFSAVLFFMGVAFGYFIISPLSVHFLGSYTVSDQIENQISFVSYISTVATITLSSAIIFELPVLVYFLSKIGIITPEFLKKYRRHAFVLVLLLSAIITPPDIFSQILVALPLTVLYEVGIVLSRRVVRQQARSED